MARCARVDAFAIARLVVGAAFLAVAATSDVRTRRVRDPWWIALGTAGLFLLALEIALSYWFWNDWLLLLSAAILFYAVFFGKPVLDQDGVHLRPLRVLELGTAAAAFVAALVLPNPWATAVLPSGAVVLPDAELASMPLMILVYQAFYQVGILRGGADAKGLIALTLLVPLYPNASPFPWIAASPAVASAMRVVFPFSLVVLADAAVLMLTVPLAYFATNLARREFEWPVGFLGTKVPIDAVPRNAWVMERIDGHGERYAVLVPSRDRDESKEVERLRAAGATRIWVETKIPFVLLLFLGFLAAFFLGNLILGALTAVLPPA